MNKLNLSDNIIRLRHERKLTQEELAEFMGVTKASVSKWEKGVNTPDLLLLPQLAAYFDVTIDELIGYEAQLSGEQIRRQYAELAKDFAACPFEDTIEKVRALAHSYYACYPFLLQLSVLYWNHYMLAETEEERRALLQEATKWCDRILENSSDASVCSDAAVVKAGLQIQLGKVQEAIEVLEPAANPSRLTGQSGTLLVQAYQLAGDVEKAISYAQAKQYLDLLDLAGDAVLALSLNAEDMGRCEETIRRITGMIELYHLESLHPNVTAQFLFQSAVVYALHGREEEALQTLFHFEKCVNGLLEAEQFKLHGDEYFDLLDAWIDRLPLGNAAPRDQSLVRQSVRESLAHPAFDRIREREEFRRLVSRVAAEASGERE